MGELEADGHGAQVEVGRVGAGEAGYEPPRLVVYGTLADLTRGIVPLTNDGVGPGSTF